MHLVPDADGIPQSVEVSDCSVEIRECTAERMGFFFGFSYPGAFRPSSPASGHLIHSHLICHSPSPSWSCRGGRFEWWSLGKFRTFVFRRGNWCALTSDSSGNQQVMYTVTPGHHGVTTLQRRCSNVGAWG